MGFTSQRDGDMPDWHCASLWPSPASLLASSRMEPPQYAYVMDCRVWLGCGLFASFFMRCIGEQGFSVSWVCLIAILTIAASTEFRRSGSKGTYSHFSRHVFPVYRVCISRGIAVTWWLHITIACICSGTPSVMLSCPTAVRQLWRTQHLRQCGCGASWL